MFSGAWRNSSIKLITPKRLSSAFARMLGPNASSWVAKVALSPTFALLLPSGPRSMRNSSTLSAFFRSSAVVRWIGLAPITAGVCSRPTMTALPTSCRGSIPPTVSKLNKPSPSSLVSIKPTSSMCAAIITRTFCTWLPKRVANTLPKASTST